MGRPQTLYTALELEAAEDRDYRLLAEMLSGLVRGKRAMGQAYQLATEWGAYLLAEAGPGPKPGAQPASGRNLALLQEAMARAGFDPRFRRQGGRVIEISLRDCPFRDLTEDHRELACTLHRGLIDGMLAGLNPPLAVREFRPLVERTICKVSAG